MSYTSYIYTAIISIQYYVNIRFCYLATDVYLAVSCCWVFFGYFDLSNSDHSYLTRSSDKLHLFSVYSSSAAKCIKFKGSQL